MKWIRTMVCALGMLVCVSLSAFAAEYGEPNITTETTMKELRENPSIKGSGYYTYCNEWIEGSTQYDDTPIEGYVSYAAAEDAAEGMTRNLDPYTEFLPEEQMSNFDLLTTGKYGGIGSMIRKKGDYVIFAQPYEGSPADRAGIRIGDKILSIEGEDTKGWDPAQISSALKGTPNTTVRIVIERLIGGEHDTLTLTRERVAIPSVPYAGFVAKGIGYIQHSDFTEGSYEEMRTAIEKLRTQDTLRGLILDYRGNGGGILQEAVKIVSMFVPKGTDRYAGECLPHRERSDPARSAVGRADQRQFGFGGRDRRRLAPGSRPGRTDRTEELRKGPRADDPSAGIQYPAETHDRQILHSLGALHPGYRLLLEQAGRHGRQGSRFARTGIYDPRRPQSL